LRRQPILRPETHRRPLLVLFVPIARDLAVMLVELHVALRRLRVAPALRERVGRHQPDA
jgi:hypothetical protein